MKLVRYQQENRGGGCEYEKKKQQISPVWCPLTSLFIPHHKFFFFWKIYRIASSMRLEDIAGASLDRNQVERYAAFEPTRSEAHSGKKGVLV